MIVRELLTLLGFTVDKASYDKASKAYDSLQGKMVASQKGTAAAAQQAAQGTGMLGQALGMVQRFAATAGLQQMGREMIHLASNANETSNVLESVFGKDHLGEIEDWSARSGAAMGRSKYSLQQYASTLGAVLGPVTASTDQAEAMAKKFAELSVDLGSFFNTTDEDAMRALRSGLTGEYESLKRYGVVLNDATLQEIANSRGMHKKVTQMSVAEKTELRYAAILKRTEAAQGDAAKTLGGFANSSKALEENLKTLKTEMGRAVLPVVNKLLAVVRDATTWFTRVSQQSHVLEVAMYALAAVAGILATEFFGAFILPAIGIAALILLVDELWTTLEGGDTVLRDILDSVFGEGTTNQLVVAFNDIKRAFDELDPQAMWDIWTNAVDSAVRSVGDFIAKVIELLGWLNPLIAGFRLVKKAGQAMGWIAQDDATGRTTERGLNAPLATPEELARLRQEDQDRQVAGGLAARKAAAEKKRFAAAQFDMMGDAAGRAGAMMPFNAASPLLAPTAGPAGAAAGQAPTVNLAAPTIVINGGDPDKVKRVVTETMEAERRKTAAALGRRGRT